jgi:hypothetical protein
MIKRIAVALATAGLAAFAFAAPASIAAQGAVDRPQNAIPPYAFHLYNEEFGTSYCARIDSSGYLIIGSGDCTKFIGEANGTIEEDTGSANPPCLYYNEDADAYDLTGCNASVSSDAWRSTGPNGWTQWYTVYNEQHGGDSMWADGTGVNDRLYAGPMSGTATADHWEALSA